MHSDDCPTSYETRRRAERDFERGQWRNPYKGSWDEDACPEAAREWDRAYHAAEERREEEAAAEERQARAQRERHEWEMREQEEQYHRDMEAQHYGQMEAEQAEAMAAQEQAPRPDDLPF